MCMCMSMYIYIYAPTHDVRPGQKNSQRWDPRGTDEFGIPNFEKKRKKEALILASKHEQECC